MTRRILFTLLLTPSAGTLLLAQHGKGKGRKNKHEDDDDRDDGERGHRFLPRDREAIMGYYGGPSGLPPGLAKRGGDLPPGLQKHLARNGTLPPGLQKKLQPLPVALEHRLPPCPQGYGRFQIGAHIVLMNRRTRVIADVLALP